MQYPAPFLDQVLLNAVTTGTGSAANLRGAVRDCTVYVIASGTVSGGTVRIEEAADSTYTGTWSSIQDVTPVTNSVVALRIPGTALAVRPRVTSNITGGATVTVRVVAK